MEDLLLRNATLLDPEATEPRRANLLIREGRIEAQLPADAATPEAVRPVELDDRLIAPGFIDLHFHGSMIFAAIDQTDAALRHDSASLLRHGVTGFLPTTVAWGQRELKDRVMLLAQAIADWNGSGAIPIGIHLEGPWLNPEAAGAQPQTTIRPYVSQEGREVVECGEGLLRLVTLAPEAPGAAQLVDDLNRRHVVAALGHTLADAATTQAAVDRGVRHVTHLFNAMGTLHHREPGAVGVALADDRLSCDLICDGVHVAPPAVRLAARSKGTNLVLITDQLDPPAAMLAPASSDSSGLVAGGLQDDGVALRLPDGRLAGSRLSLDRAIRNVQEWGALSLLEAVAAVTLRPAHLLGIESERGTLRRGARADLVVLNTSGGVEETWLAGRKVDSSF